jgi:hypothetical protein
MKIDKTSNQGLQQLINIKGNEATIDKVKETVASLPVAPVKPEGETSTIGELGTAARSISGEDLIDSKENLPGTISQAMEMIVDEGGELQ